MAGLQIVIFHLNNDLYAVDSSCVKQIIKYQTVTQRPEMPVFIEGFIDLRGIDIPIINLNKRLDYPVTEITKTTKIIIAEISSGQLGFLVDEINELARFDESQIEILPEIIQKAGNSYLKKVAKREEQIISILELESILKKSEIKKLAQ